jgi:hypothetical protein
MLSKYIVETACPTPTAAYIVNHVWIWSSHTSIYNVKVAMLVKRSRSDWSILASDNTLNCRWWWGGLSFKQLPASKSINTYLDSVKARHGSEHKYDGSQPIGIWLKCSSFEQHFIASNTRERHLCNQIPCTNEVFGFGQGQTQFKT